MPSRAPSVAVVVLVASITGCTAPSESGADSPPYTGDYRMVFGDLHAHTGASGDGCASDVAEHPNEGCGGLEGIAEEAAAAGLDFLALTDHVNGPNLWSGDAGDAAWREVVDTAFSSSGPDLLVLPGTEISATISDGEGVVQPLGHKTVLFFGEEPELAGIVRSDTTPAPGANTNVASCERIWRWAQELETKAGPVLMFPHHPAVSTPMPTDFACHDEELEPVVELYSHFGSSRIVNPMAPDYDPPIAEDGSLQAGTPTGAVQYLLTHFPDVRTGFLAGTDSHDTRPGEVCSREEGSQSSAYGGGLTGVWIPEAEALTRETLRESLVAHHTVATSGPKVAAWVRVLSTDGRPLALAGEELEAAEAAVLRVEVPDPIAAEVTAAWAVSGGLADGAETRAAMAATGAGAWELPLSPASGTFVYVMLELAGPNVHPEGCDDGGDDTERVWVSPDWFR